uniref:Uncharacterized protein n=1 Tax=uncultured bacterium A1Q1_fos_2067 TaxID=1256560 RepID=L7VQC9_9BACT|nr:hypothetical protein [uncultured bacterium A1Q1_fos_2067]
MNSVNAVRAYGCKQIATFLKDRMNVEIGAARTKESRLITSNVS